LFQKLNNKSQYFGGLIKSSNAGIILPT